MMLGDVGLGASVLRVGVEASLNVNAVELPDALAASRCLCGVTPKGQTRGILRDGALYF